MNLIHLLWHRKYGIYTGGPACPICWKQIIHGDHVVRANIYQMWRHKDCWK